MADLKSLQKKVFDAVDKSPRKEDESVGDYEKRLSKKYPLLKKQVNKLTLAERTALWGDQESRTAMGFGTSIGNVPGYPGKKKKKLRPMEPRVEEGLEKALKRQGISKEEFDKQFKEEDARIRRLKRELRTGEKKGGKIKNKNYSKGGGVRPASY
jgi:hypothetical protein